MYSVRYEDGDTEDEVSWNMIVKLNEVAFTPIPLDQVKSGEYIDFHGSADSKWYEAKCVQVTADGFLQMTFKGWRSAFDEYVSASLFAASAYRFAPRYTFTKRPKARKTAEELQRLRSERAANERMILKEMQKQVSTDVESDVVLMTTKSGRIIETKVKPTQTTAAKRKSNAKVGFYR